MADDVAQSPDGPGERGELAFVERLRARLPAPPPSQVGVGDDAAVLSDGRLVCTDLLVEGVHFRSAWATAGDIGWKAMAVNLSDIAAMGGEPEAAVAAVAVPPDRHGLADDLLDGLVACAEAFGCPLVGGDTSTGPGLYVAVTVTGHAEQPILRSGAQPGDTVFVTAPLGAAAAILEQLDAGERVDDPSPLHRPIPRLAEGSTAAGAGATAMLDLSDGLALDLTRLATASKVAIELTSVPTARGTTEHHALTGGDDYELTFTAPDPDRIKAAFATADLHPPIAIGTVTEGSGVTREGVPLSGGWQHDIA